MYALLLKDLSTSNDVCIKLGQMATLVFVFMSTLTVTTMISFYGCVKMRNFKNDQKYRMDLLLYKAKVDDYSRQYSSTLTRFWWMAYFTTTFFDDLFILIKQKGLEKKYAKKVKTWKSML